MYIDSELADATGLGSFFRLDANLKPIKSYYLRDAEAAAKAAAAVASQGKA